MKTAFVFAQLANVQDAGAVHKSLHGVSGVKTVYFLTGPTDVLMQIEYNELDDLMAVVGKIHGVQGVASTDTRLALPI